MTQSTDIQDISDIEAQAYAEFTADEIPTVIPGNGMRQSLIEACAVDFGRGNEDLSALWSLV